MNEYTLEELKEKLASQFDEETLIDLLGINSFQIVEAFSGLIEDNYNKLMREVD